MAKCDECKKTIKYNKFHQYKNGKLVCLDCYNKRYQRKKKITEEADTTDLKTNPEDTSTLLSASYPKVKEEDLKEDEYAAEKGFGSPLGE